ncbi:MAG TPA: hypothetical protein VEW03_00575 [Longimicrobiaceae bacterium]|nr:hypothetical protein [Longimicrobiaceae bacterium]
MTRYPLALALLVASAAPLAAQLPIATCAAADSVIGPPPRRLPSLIHRYDRLTDSTQLELRKEVVRLISSSPDASWRLITAYEGSQPSSTPLTTLQVVVATDKNTGMTDQQVSQAQARMLNIESAPALIDGSTRIRLTRVGHSAQVQQGNLLRDARLLEIAVFEITPDQLRQMATATNGVEIAAGPVRGGFSRGDLPAIKEIYRITACAAPPAPAAAPAGS